MNTPLELCAQLDEVVQALESTPATEANLGTIKLAVACGFRAIAENIKSAYQSTAASQVPPPPNAPSEQPGNADPAMLAGSEAPTPAAAVEGSAE